jgi:hypothetical protein
LHFKITLRNDIYTPLFNPRQPLHNQNTDDKFNKLILQYHSFNATILAYGQTGSGKTYSMGTAIDGANIPPEHQGIVPRAIYRLFDDLEAKKANHPEFTYEIAVNFLELYNEDLIDLLNPQSHENKKAKSELMIREDANGQIYWSGVKEVVVSSPDELLE